MTTDDNTGGVNSLPQGCKAQGKMGNILLKPTPNNPPSLFDPTDNYLF
jgi:hypothetical protein